MFNIHGVALSVATFLVLISCENESINVSKTKESISESTEIIQSTKTATLKNTKKIIYLTFDDGPNKGTENVVKTLHRCKTPATMFVIGKHVYGSKSQTQIFNNLTQDTLLLVANHSYTHANNQYQKYYNSPDEVVKDFHLNQIKLKLKTTISRTPGRNIWRLPNVNITDIKKTKKAADSLGKHFQLYGWDLEWKYAKHNTLKNNGDEMLKKIDSVFSNKLTQNENHLILLTHDQLFDNEQNTQELYTLIMQLKETKKYDFRLLSQYPNIKD